jgi:hypothetical protein
MTHKAKHLSVFALILLSYPGVNAFSQNTGPMLVDIQPCVNISDHLARLTCYDQLGAATANQLEVNAQQPVLPQTGELVESDTAVEDAVESVDLTATDVSGSALNEGQNTQAIADFGRQNNPTARLIQTEDGQQEMLDRIVAMSQREPNKWLITLESGQVWYQTNSARTRLRIGDDVRIYLSPLGSSYRMAKVDSQSGFIQVHRVE